MDFGTALAPASAPSSTFDMQDADSSITASVFIRGLLAVLILALIGFNVFTYLDDITAWFGNTFGAPFRSVARGVGNAAADTAQTTVNVTAQGTKSAVDIAAGAATSGIDVLQQTLESSGPNQIKPDNDDNVNVKDKVKDKYKDKDRDRDRDAVETALSHAKKQPPQPDDATSRTQRTGKSGYCYIGEDRGFRSCIKVGEQDTCMSGDIFPTQAICINPRLRQ